MFNNLINIAGSGINAANNAMGTVGNNINNAYVAGYNRQHAVFSQADGLLTSSGFLGNGVQVSGISRDYNSFIVGQLRDAQTQSAAKSTYHQFVSQIDDLLADGANSLSSGLQGFFTNVQAVVNNASDISARQTMLGGANALASQFRDAASYLNNLDSNINQQITENVDQINAYTKQIADINEQIARLQGSAGGASPNALLDQRDLLVSQLNQVVGVKVTEQDGAYNISFANGLSLVQGNQSHDLVAMPSSADPSRTTLGYNDGRNTVEIGTECVTSGTLGGALTSRQAVDDARNQLGVIALNMASSVNQQHNAGFDLNGDAGKDFFNFTNGIAINNTKNTGDVNLTVNYADATKVQATDYKVSFEGGEWSVTRMSDGSTVTTTAGTDADGNPTLEFDGLSISVEGTPAEKDSFVVKPVGQVASSFSVAISNPAEIAAAGAADSGSGDNENMKALLELQNKKLVGGKATLSTAYASLVSDIGNRTNTAKLDSQSQDKITLELTKQQQSISGVNLDIEYMDLQRFQQYYLANAQVLQAATSTFDALLNAVRQ